MHRGPPDSPLPVGRTLFAAAASDGQPAEIGPVAIISTGQDDASSFVVVRPAAGFPAEKLEELRFDLGGPWTLSDQPLGAWPAHYTESLDRKEFIHAESLLIIDP